jgi:hypothetical protein
MGILLGIQTILIGIVITAQQSGAEILRASALSRYCHLGSNYDRDSRRLPTCQSIQHDSVYRHDLDGFSCTIT